MGGSDLFSQQLMELPCSSCRCSAPSTSEFVSVLSFSAQVAIPHIWRRFAVEAHPRIRATILMYSFSETHHAKIFPAVQGSVRSGCQI